MIYRTWGCDDCGATWEVHHETGDDLVPECPNCSKVLQWRPTSFAIGGSTEGKAVKYAQSIMEEDYGLSNFKDNNKPGEVGYIDPTRKTTSEAEKIQREVAEMTTQVGNSEAAKAFWGANAGPSQTTNSVNAQTMIQMAKVGPQGVDPMAMLHRGVKSGDIPTLRQMTRVVAKADR